MDSESVEEFADQRPPLTLDELEQELYKLFGLWKEYISFLGTIDCNIDGVNDYFEKFKSQIEVVAKGFGDNLKKVRTLSRLRVSHEAEQVEAIVQREALLGKLKEVQGKLSQMRNQ